MNRKTAIIALFNGETMMHSGFLYRITQDSHVLQYSDNGGKIWESSRQSFNSMDFPRMEIYEAPKKIVAFKHDSDGSIIFAEENSTQFRALKSNHFYEQLELTQELMIAATKK